MLEDGENLYAFSPQIAKVKNQFGGIYNHTVWSPRFLGFTAQLQLVLNGEAIVTRRIRAETRKLGRPRASLS